MRTPSPNLQIVSFVVLTYLMSWTIQAVEIHAGQSQNSVHGFILMWTPGIIAMFLSFIFGLGRTDLAFLRPGFKSLVISYMVPAISSVFVLGLIISLRITDFEISQQAIAKKGSVESVLVTAFLVGPTVGMVFPFVSALGEEIGWRGFLHSKLVNLSANSRYLSTGLIWSIWHWPLIIFGTYATSESPWLSVVIFTVAQTSFSFLLGALRDKTKSVFPATLAHASHNMWFLGLTPVFFKQNSLTPYFAGESGVFCAVIYAGIAVYIARCQKKVI